MEKGEPSTSNSTEPSTSKTSNEIINFSASLPDTRNLYKEKFTDDLKITLCEEEVHFGVSFEHQTFILIHGDSDEGSSTENVPDSNTYDSDEGSLTENDSDSNIDDSDEDNPARIQTSQRGRRNYPIHWPSLNINRSAMQVNTVSNKAILTIPYQPWADYGFQYISECCQKGQDHCEKIHGENSYRLNPEEGEENEEEYFERCFKIMDPDMATTLLETAISGGTNPPAHIIQYILLKIVDRSENDMTKDLVILNQLLKRHAPCDNHMLNFYKKILFAPLRCLYAPDGVFWWCIYKIEDLMSAFVEMKSKLRDDSYRWLDDHFEYSKCVRSRYENTINEHYFKLTRVFCILDFIIKIMEAELSMGLLKNLTELSQYAYSDDKPIIAMAFWTGNFDVGATNLKVRHLMKFYFEIFRLFQDTEFPNHCRRLLSLTAGVIYASQVNFDSPVFPSIRFNCKEFGSRFAYVLVHTESLTLSDVLEILKALRPVWFQFLVCSYLLEILDGRSEYKTLNSLLGLLQELNEINQNFPSSQEMSTILFRHSSDTYREDGKIPRNLYVKLAVLTPLCIVLHIKLFGISKIDTTLNYNIRLPSNHTVVKFNHPSLEENCIKFRELKNLVQRTEYNKMELVETLAFLNN